MSSEINRNGNTGESNYPDYRRPTDRVTTPPRLDEQIVAAAKEADRVIGESPLAAGRNAVPALPSRETHSGLPNREDHFKAGLHPASRLRSGLAGIFYRDPLTGRVRPAREDDSAEDCFVTA